MQLAITGQHLPLTDAIKSYVTGKMEKLDRRHPAQSAHVVLHVEGVVHRAEATVHWAGDLVHAEARAESMYAAIDLLMDKLSRQHRKTKTSRLRSRHDQSREAAWAAVPS